MGLPIAESRMISGKKIIVFDIAKKTIKIAKKKLDVVENLCDLVTTDVTTIITMLPEGKHSKEVYLGENGIIDKVLHNFLRIDCSTSAV